MDRVINGILLLLILGCLAAIAYLEFHTDQQVELSKSLALSGYADFMGVKYYPKYLNSSEFALETRGNKTTITFDRALTKRSVLCTGSMHPFIGCGNTVLTEDLGPGDVLNVGDIVVYHNGDVDIGHQIVGKNEGDDCYYIKGSNVLLQDPLCVKRDQIFARIVVVIPTG